MKTKKIFWFLFFILILGGFFVFLNPKEKMEINENDNKDDLVFLSILPNQKVSGTMNIIGSIRNAYFFEANILINVLDVDKKVIKSGHGTATSDWMTIEPVSFETTINFSSLPKGPAYLEIRNDNPSGLPEKDKSIYIPIIIE